MSAASVPRPPCKGGRPATPLLGGASALLQGPAQQSPVTAERPDANAPIPRAVTTYYKALGFHGESIFGGQARWRLPTRNKPGEWMPPVGQLSPGATGYHLASAGQLLRDWLAQRLFVAEGRGASLLLPDGDMVVREARLVRELRWDLDVALRLYRACLDDIVAEARRHGDFVDEGHHRRLLSHPRSWPPDGMWHVTVRLGLAELAVALGGVWHRAARRHHEVDVPPLGVYIERAHAWQANRLLVCLHEPAASGQSAACGDLVAPGALWNWTGPGTVAQFRCVREGSVCPW